jgi:hypothetical protein
MKKMIMVIFLSFTSFLYGLDYFNVPGWIINGNLVNLEAFIDNLNGNGDSGYYNSIRLLNRTALRLLRNTIYAKHGYIFNSIDLQEHFSRFSWYSGTKTNVNNELTINEWRVIEFISQMEDNYPSYVSNEIIGTWYNDLPDDWWKYSPYDLAWWYDDRQELQFFPNGIFTYEPEEPRHIEHSILGLWSLDGNIFKVTFSFIRIYDPERHILYFNIHHHNIYTNAFNENIFFYNRNITNFWGVEVELWECNFQRNLPSWKKITTDPYFVKSDNK